MATPQSRPPNPIPRGDPLESILLSVGGPVELSALMIESSAIAGMRAAGVSMVVPIIAHGDLLGALLLSGRLSDQRYSSDDRRLLASLANQVAPAIRVAQLVREQQVEAKERERIQQEMQVAALIQQTLLPKDVPRIDGWHVDALYLPARAVGGDFYDFIQLRGDRLGVVIGDVTDKGVPAALVMATCRSMLRAAAIRHDSPATVLGDVNRALVDEIPPAMFVTCLYAVVDVVTGEIVFANAGHNLPYVRGRRGITELRATGMPLGLLPDSDYDESVHRLEEGDVMVLSSDGITEAHNAEGEMYGFPRLMGQVAVRTKVGGTIDRLVEDLDRWTGADVEQEDDVTLVVITRATAPPMASTETSTNSSTDSSTNSSTNRGEVLLASFLIPSVDGNERMAIERVAAVADHHIDESQLERLKTAVGETIMNAIEHGNDYDADLDVAVEVALVRDGLRVRISDHGGDKTMPEIGTPDLEAKLAGEQTPRGWGLYLAGQMVDEMETSVANGTRTVELVVDRRET